MLPGDRKVGELWCSEVLEALSEYLDGELPPDTVALVEAHVTRCDNCARFGAEFAGVVRDLRAGLGDAPPLASDVGARLRQRLATS